MSTLTTIQFPFPVISQPTYDSLEPVYRENEWNSSSPIPGLKNGDLAGPAFDKTREIVVEKASDAWKNYAEKSANNAFNQYVIRNSAGQFSKGSNAMAGQLAQSAVNQDFESGMKGVAGNSLEFLSKPLGSTIFSFGAGTAMDLASGASPDEALGKNIISSAGSGTVLAIGAFIPGPGWIFDAGAMVVGMANSALYNSIPFVKKVEDDTGHNLINLWGGESGSDVINSKIGNLSISSGDKYLRGIGHVAISLYKGEVESLASTILSSTDNFCAKMKKINDSIPQALEDAKSEVQTSITSMLFWTYPHLTDGDVANEMAKYPTKAMYNIFDITTSNTTIDNLGGELASISSNLKKVANGMEDMDQATATQMYAAATSGAAQPTKMMSTSKSSKASSSSKTSTTSGASKSSNVFGSSTSAKVPNLFGLLTPSKALNSLKTSTVYGSKKTNRNW